VTQNAHSNNLFVIIQQFYYSLADLLKLYAYVRFFGVLYFIERCIILCKVYWIRESLDDILDKLK